jgi:SAM-dependent methyltransferase
MERLDTLDGWMRRWEAQQGRMRLREARYEIIITAVRAHCGDSPQILDLGSGPGSLGVRLTAAIPGCRVVGIDADPVLLELGRRILADNDRISFIDANLADPDLVRVGRGFDAAVSTTALHWLQLEPLRQLYRSLAVMLKPGGIFLNGDWLHGSGSPTIDALLLKMRGRDAGEPPADEGETFEQWWEAIRAEPALKAAFAERDRRHYGHADDDNLPTLLDHEMGLRNASFSEVGTLWQYINSRVLAAIR